VRFAIVCGGGGGVPRAMNAGTRERASGRQTGRPGGRRQQQQSNEATRKITRSDAASCDAAS